jgi:cytochrome P450
MRHITAALDAFSEARIQALLGLPLVPMTLKGLAGRRGQHFLRETLSQLVRDRSSNLAPGDFLAGMIAALRERFDPAQAHALAVDNAATFYLAGTRPRPMPSPGLCSCSPSSPSFRNRQPKRRAVRSRRAARISPTGCRCCAGSLRNRCVSTRRCHAWTAKQSRRHSGRPRDRRGDFISIWPWLIHRHKDLWDDPDAFDIGRFTPEKRPHRFQYIPFGGGPRMCIGARFAMAEALTILSHWISRWRLSPLPGRQVRASGMVTLRPAGGLPLLISAR